LLRLCKSYYYRAALGLLTAVLLCCVTALAQVPAQGHSGAWNNSDSSNKLILEFAGGYDPAIGATKKSQQNSWNVTLGSGYNFSRRWGVMLEYGFVHSSVPDLYLEETFPWGGDFAHDYDYGLKGNVRVWSITAEPTYHFWNGQKNGAYVLVGGGFYRKNTVLQNGSSDVACNFYFPAPCTSGSVGYSNNAGGLNAGLGLAHRVGTYTNAKLFIDARYVLVDNQASPNNTGYPAANQRTTYSPLTAGVRW
jgi:hypothetical protein